MECFNKILGVLSARFQAEVWPQIFQVHLRKWNLFLNPGVVIDVFQCLHFCETAGKSLRVMAGNKQSGITANQAIVAKLSDRLIRQLKMLYYQIPLIFSSLGKSCTK